MTQVFSLSVNSFINRRIAFFLPPPFSINARNLKVKGEGKVKGFLCCFSDIGVCIVGERMRGRNTMAVEENVERERE